MEQLRELEHWVARLGAQFLLAPALAHHIDLCLTELVSNVIRYGYPDGKPGTVSGVSPNGSSFASRMMAPLSTRLLMCRLCCPPHWPRRRPEAEESDWCAVSPTSCIT